MKRILWTAVAWATMVGLLLLPGCAKQEDVHMVQAHMQAEIEIARAKAEAISSQSEALALSLDESMSDLERYFARQQIAQLRVDESGIKAPTTGNDVVMTLTKDGRYIIRDIVTGTVIYRGVIGLTDALKNSGNTSIEVSGDGNSVDNTRSDVKTVVAGENNTANVSAQAGSTSAGGSSAEEELSGECDEAVESAVAGMDLDAINLGGAMRELAAQTGCVVHIEDGQVVVKETGTPVEALNSKWASHPELGGGAE